MSAGEAVADAGVGADVAALAGGLDLAPQVGDVGAQDLGVVGVLRRPRPRPAARGGSSAGRGWRTSARSRSNSIGVRWTSSPSRRTMRAARSISQPVDARSPARPARRRARRSAASQPRDQLARAERLGHVVVGAGLERLAPSRPPRRPRESTMIGICAPLAQPPADLDAVAVGQHQVDDRGVGRAHGGAVERLLDRRGRRRLVAGLAQDDLQRAQDLRARRRRRARAGRVAHAGALLDAAARRRSVAPWPGQRLDPHAPAVGLDEAAHDGQPQARAAMAVAGRPARGRRARRSRSRSAAGTPGPRSTTRTRMRGPTARARTETGWPPE